MTKIKLYEIGNEGNFNWYTFDKKQQIAEYLSMILSKIFHNNIHWEFDTLKDKKVNVQKKQVVKIVTEKINIEKSRDYHETISSGEKIRIDVFYGDKKMFITINCSQEDRLKFNEELFKIAEMPKSKKLNKEKSR